MYILYFDEAGDPSISKKSLEQNPLFVLGGCALFEGNWDSLQKKMDNISVSLFPKERPSAVEFHFSEIRKGQSIWNSFEQQKRKEIILNLLSEVDKLNKRCLTYFAVVIDKRDIGKQEDVFQKAFETLINRFDLFLKKHFALGYPNKGMLVCDLLLASHKSSEKKIYPMIELFKTKGTKWAPLRNIVEKVFFHDSKNSRVVQLADFVASSVMRYYNKGEQEYIDIIKNRFDQEYHKTQKKNIIHGLQYIGRDIHLKQYKEILFLDK